MELVSLTRAAAVTRGELDREYQRPPPEIRGLPKRDLKELARILAKVAPPAQRE